MVASKAPRLFPRLVTGADLVRFKNFDCGDEDYQQELVEFLFDDALAQAAHRFSSTYVFYGEAGSPLAFVALACSSVKAWKELSASGGNLPVLLIEMLAVDRTSQHRGMGHEILAWIGDKARDLGVGCRYLALYCDERNRSAHAFYEREGFFEPPGATDVCGDHLLLYDLGRAG